MKLTEEPEEQPQGYINNNPRKNSPVFKNENRSEGQNGSNNVREQPRRQGGVRNKAPVDGRRGGGRTQQKQVHKEEYGCLSHPHFIAHKLINSLSTHRLCKAEETDLTYPKDKLFGTVYYMFLHFNNGPIHI